MITVFISPTEKEKEIFFSVAKTLGVPARLTRDNPELPKIWLIEFEFDSLQDHYAFLELSGYDIYQAKFVS